jgi:arylsulfatase A-like enzyme
VEDNFSGARTIISGDYKLVIDGEKNTGVELFDLKVDPAEENNLAQSKPEVVEQMDKQLRKWQKDVLNSLMEQDYE